MSALVGWLSLQAAVGHHVPAALLELSPEELPADLLEKGGLLLARNDGGPLMEGLPVSCLVVPAADLLGDSRVFTYTTGARGLMLQFPWYPPAPVRPHGPFTAVQVFAHGATALLSCQHLWDYNGTSSLRLECVSMLAQSGYLAPDHSAGSASTASRS